MMWTPRPDQAQVLQFMDQRKRLAVFAPTGAGKTAMACTWADGWMNDACTLRRLLIVAPKLVARDGWPAEIARWDHLGDMRDLRVLGAADFGLGKPSAAWMAANPGAGRGHQIVDKRATKRHLLQLQERVHVVSWDFWPWLVKAYGSNFPYQGIVFDESSFLRDQGSERCKAARHAVHRTGAVDHILLLTGTPAANHGDALYPQVDLVAPDLLGKNLTEFRGTWCQPASQNWSTGQVYSYKINPMLQDKLNELVATVAVSVPSCLTVPMVEVDHSIIPSEACSRAVAAMEKTSVWGTCTAGSEAVLHGKVRQMASGFVYDDNEAVLFLDNNKMDRLQELVESIDGPVLIAFEFHEELRRLRERFGKQLRDIRETGAKAAFLAGKLKILAVHPQSAGHGVDGLQGVTNQVIWTTVPQDLELYAQLNGRVHRHGTQADTVYVHRLIMQGTIEERIASDVLPGKLTLAEAFLTGVRL